MQISPETTPSMPSTPEIRIGILTLAGEKEDAGGNLKPKAIQTLPPRSRAPLSSPPPARAPEERGPADRWREERVALEIAFSCRRGKTVRDEVCGAPERCGGLEGQDLRFRSSVLQFAYPSYKCSTYLYS
jgi:hypothetical protein